MVHLAVEEKNILLGAKLWLAGREKDYVVRKENRRTLAAMKRQKLRFQTPAILHGDLGPHSDGFNREQKRCPELLEKAPLRMS